ncbi:MAG: uracil-DNA glycosylase family protein [Patescibacteria group bacterium]
MDNKLINLYQKIDKCPFCSPSRQNFGGGGKSLKNPLQHIHGFGTISPKFMLILINPTYRNISSNPKYIGPRFPFIGVRQFWKVLGDAGLINKKIACKLPKRQDWSKTHTKQIQNELLKNKLFLTNIVKCCYNHSSYPDKRVIEAQLRFLKEEIKIVRPKKIIAFGALVFKILTGESIHLSNYWNNISRLCPSTSSGLRSKYNENISGLNIKVLPCYFPIGRGNPNKAINYLKRIK